MRQYWREALLVAAEKIVANSNTGAADNLRKAITETLLVQTAGGEHHAALKALLVLDESAQQPFEVLILGATGLARPFAATQHITRENAMWCAISSPVLRRKMAWNQTVDHSEATVLP